MVEVQEVGQVLGLGLVATSPVAAGATVLEEEPLWTVSIEKIFNDHAFLQRKDVQAIVAAVAAGDAALARPGFPWHRDIEAARRCGSQRNDHRARLA